MKNLLEQVNEKLSKKQVFTTSAIVVILLVGGVTAGIINHNNNVHAQQVAQKAKAASEKKEQAEKLAKEKEQAQEKEVVRLFDVATKNPTDATINAVKSAISKLTDTKAQAKALTSLNQLQGRLDLREKAQAAVKDYQAHATDANKQKVAQEAINKLTDKNDTILKSQLQKLFDDSNKQAQAAAKAAQAQPKQVNSSKNNPSSNSNQQGQATQNEGKGSSQEASSNANVGGGQANNYAPSQGNNAPANTGGGGGGAPSPQPSPSSQPTPQPSPTPQPTPQPTPTIRYAGVVTVNGAVKYRQVFDSESQAAAYAYSMYKQECLSDWTSDIGWYTEDV